MPEPLKNLYTTRFVHSLCTQIENIYKDFDSEGFTEHLFDSAWINKELKQRMRHFSETLHQFLPHSYSKAIDILVRASANFNGFEYMFFPDYVECYGLDDFNKSMSALAHFTQYSSSEFAVRPFIIKEPHKMMAQMNTWANSKDHHIRRLASEGCRPRLPWAMSLPEFKKDPSPIFPILEKLKNDESEYVRRSVANNLNDISKDHPDIVIKMVKSWFNKNRNTDRLVKHACRTLLKQAHPEAMILFGLAQPKHIKINHFIVQKSVKMGEKLSFSLTLKSQRPLGRIRIEYGIDFMKKNGRQSRKIFKLSESDTENQEKNIQKTYSFKKISTRKYYPGIHKVAIIINGYELAQSEFLLKSSL